MVQAAPVAQPGSDTSGSGGAAGPMAVDQGDAPKEQEVFGMSSIAAAAAAAGRAAARQ